MVPPAVRKKANTKTLKRKPCAVGLNLNAAFNQKANDWITAEAAKRSAVASVAKDEWRKIARGVDSAKREHDSAFSEYVNHVIGCSGCRGYVKQRAP